MTFENPENPFVAAHLNYFLFCVSTHTHVLSTCEWQKFLSRISCKIKLFFFIICQMSVKIYYSIVLDHNRSKMSKWKGGKNRLGWNWCERNSIKVQCMALSLDFLALQWKNRDYFHQASFQLSPSKISVSHSHAIRN